MKVLLIRAKPTRLQNTRLPKSLLEELGCVAPLGLASVAAYLREKGISVKIIDADAENLSLQLLRQKMQEYNPNIVGITSMTPTVHDDLAVAKVAKEVGAYVVIGGPQVNAMPCETIQFEQVDFGILGEGEYPMFKLCEALSEKNKFADVPGLIYKEDRKILMNSPYIHFNLDELPVPARDLLPHKRYSSLIAKGRLTTISPGRGCPFTCGFCFKQPSDKVIRFRNPKFIVNEIEEVINRYSIEEINFVSDTLTLKSSFIEEICNEIIERKIKISWIAPTRADCLNPELLRLMKQSGCRSLRIGVESGSPEILSLMGKKTDHEQLIRVFRWIKKAQIQTFAYFIIGYLNETEETVRQTLRFVKKIKPDLIMYNIATPLPGTKLFSQAVEAGLVEPDYWQNFIKDENYPRIPYLFKDTEKWIKKAYWDFFFSPEFIFNKIFEIRPGNVLNYLKALKGLIELKI